MWHYTLAEEYKFGFNGKEMENDWNEKTGAVYDYGFRIYDARIAKFLSVDPLFKEYPMLTSYQFASNTPIQAIDLDGLEAFFVGGTWDGYASTWEKEGMVELTALFGNSSYYRKSWSGNNNSTARKIDANTIAKEMYNTWQEGGGSENITVFGHSHGGNVSVEIVNVLVNVYKVDPSIITLVTVNTPVIDDHQVEGNAKNVRHFNIYNKSDVFQRFGGKGNHLPGDTPVGLSASSKSKGENSKYDYGHYEMTGECGFANRTFDNAINISYKHIPSTVGDVFINHMGNSNRNIKQWSGKIKEQLGGNKAAGYKEKISNKKFK